MHEWVEMLNKLLSEDETKIIYVLTLILIANVFDFTLGWTNAKFNVGVTFSTSKAIMGLTRKIALFMLLIFFVPVALLVPYPIGISALYVLYLGYLVSEINSILNHLSLADDDKDINNFKNFIVSIFERDKHVK